MENIACNTKRMKIKRSRLLFIVLVNVSTLISTNLFAQNPDIDLLKFINPRNPNSSYWKNTSTSAYWVSGGVAIGTLIYGLANDNEQAKHNAYETLISIGSAELVTELFKYTINRTRPADRYPNEVFVTSPSHKYSFPSGHTSLAFATATTLSLQYHKWYITVPAYLWAGSVGYSRMYLGKHYPTDVLGGAAVGMGGAYAGHWLNKKIFSHYYNKGNSNKTYD